jgi:hypothetical protein
MATPTSLPASFSAGNVLTAQQMNDLRGAFRILQVVSTTKTDTFSLTSSTFTDITGLTASITPQSTDSKVLVLVNCSLRQGTGNPLIKLVRGSTDICIGDAAGSRQRVSIGNYNTGNGSNLSFHFLDSPASTSSQTYKLQIRAINSAAAAIVVQVGATGDDGDRGDNGRFPSSITLLEVSA